MRALCPTASSNFSSGNHDASFRIDRVVFFFLDPVFFWPRTRTKIVSPKAWSSLEESGWQIWLCKSPTFTHAFRISNNQMSVVLQHPLFSYTTTTICTRGESLAFDAGESAHTTPRLELLSQSGIILVRDPPRERLPGTRSSEEHEQVLQHLPSFLVSVYLVYFPTRRG